MSQDITQDGQNTAFQSSILEYLEHLPKELSDKLYLKPAPCFAAFRLLQTLSKQIVMSLLFIQDPVPKQDVMVWAKQKKTSVFVDQLERLKKLSILIEENGKIKLHPSFCKQLIGSLTGGQEHGNFIPVRDNDCESQEELLKLDKYAGEKWESVLHYMVGTTTKKTQPSKNVLQLLSKSNLMYYKHGEPQITSKGFQFLLYNICEQIWMILLQYLYMEEEEGSDVVSILSIFFELGSLEFGKTYKVTNLTELESQVLSDLEHLGFLYRRRSAESLIVPTRLVTILTGASISSVKATLSALNSKKSTSDDSSSHTFNTSGYRLEENGANDLGFILLETNYRLYAYTDSILQISILSLFTQMVYRFPNLVVGSITRDSIRVALKKGITADQIISYLNTYAHPQVRNQIPPVPITVSDQIKLWEKEKERIVAKPSYLYHEFNRQHDFEAVHKYAEQLGVVLWADEKRRIMAVSFEGHESVKGFVKRRMSTKQPPASASR